MTIVTLVSGCGKQRRAGRAMGEQHCTGSRVSRHRLVAGATVADRLRLT